MTATTGTPAAFPSSFGQQRLWILDQLEGAGAAYNVPVAIHIRRPIQGASLNRAFRALIQRHEPLRTTFGIDRGEVRQLVQDEVDVELRHVDLRALDAPSRERAWRDDATREATQPFDLAAGPLIRAVWFQLTERDHIILVTLHHIIFDGWSEHLLVRDLEALYAVEAGEPAPELPELPVQYADFAMWQRERQESSAGTSDLAFWTKTLAGAPTTMSLPTDRRLNPARRFAGSSRTMEIDAATAAAIRSFARAEQTTTFVVLLAAFAVVLSRFSDQNDLIIGTPVSGRARPEVADLIGFFVNTLPLRVRLRPEMSGHRLVAEARDVVSDALLHQATPFERIVESTRSAEGRLALQVLFSVDHRPAATTEPTWRSDLNEIPTGTAKLDLAVGILDADTMQIAAEYPAGVFDAATVDSMLGTFVRALESLTSSPESKVGEWTLVAPADRDRLLNEWSGRHRAAVDAEFGVDRYFDRIADEAPRREAVVSAAHSLTYADLRSQADGIATRLVDLVAPGDVVGVIVDRSVNYIAALIGILKAGAAYLPIDLGNPASRVNLMLHDAQARVIVGRPEDATGLDPDLRWIDPSTPGTGPPVRRETSANDLAYVMFTSGSTGTPKGVAIEHGSIVRLVREADYATLGPDTRMLHLSTGSFDLSTLEIWGALLNGGCIVVAPTTTPTFQQLGHLILAGRVTTMWLTSTYFNTVINEAPDVLKPVRELLVGGEALSLAHVRRALVLLPQTTLVNGYGPTETTTFAATFRIPRDFDEWAKSVPIGGPLPGTQLFVLDRSGQLAPPGAPGELHIGGTGVARGYVNKPAETARAFVTGAIPGLPAERVYRSGDLARWRGDATLEFLGRDDGQVKLRGYRIELGEVEAALRAHSSVSDAAAALKRGIDGSLRLVAYVVPIDAAPAPEAFQAHLRGHLPEYMLPSAYVVLDSLPRTTSGKLDRHALPAPPAQTRADAPSAPATDSQTRLAAIFERVLQTADVGVDEDFFALGGHSLLAIQLFSEIECEFHKQLPLHLLATAPTIRALAFELDRNHWSTPQTPGVRPLREGQGPHGVYIPFSLGGDLLFCAELAARISTNIPVWGLTPPEGVDQTNMRAIASAMADRLLAHAGGSGPILVGYSFSGLLAYEIAVEIERRGGFVPLVAVIDSGPPLSPSISRTIVRPLRVLRNLPYWLYDDILASSPRALAGRLRRKVGAWMTRSRGAMASRPSDPAVALFEDMYGGQQVAEEYRHHVEEHLRALLAHRPGRYRGPFVVFRARTRPLLHSLEPDLGWKSCVDGRVEIVAVPCNHDNVLRAPHVDEIARNLSARIAALP